MNLLQVYLQMEIAKVSQLLLMTVTQRGLFCHKQFPSVIIVGAGQLHILPNGKKRVIEFTRRSLTKMEEKYAQVEKEGLAILSEVKKFTHFLYSGHIMLLTDHRLLTRSFGP
eukprot:g27692.t1